MINEKPFLHDNHDLFMKLLKDIPYNRYATFLPELTERIKQIYVLKYASIYIYNNWKNVYERYDDEQNLPLHVHESHEVANLSILDVHDRADSITMDMIPINPRPGPYGFLVVASSAAEENVNNDLSALQEMLSNVCNYLNVYEKNIQLKEKSDFLLNVRVVFIP